ncbi:MAG: esterase family protein [Akkermansiaceae bacterium]|nr:esterase family protein [Akkermansiaceae bacterium]
MQDLGGGVQLLVKKLPNCVEFTYGAFTASGKKAGGGRVRIEDYPFTPDSIVQEGVPQGTVEKHAWNDSTVFPGTEREFLVYVPAQYDPAHPAGLLVFQDGLRHADRDGSMRAITVMDNLIHKGEMPVAIGVFINPGRLKGQDPKAKPKNRSFEYDSLGDQYARFLHEEILPFVAKKYTISDNPRLRCIAGGSSGAICAWTVAWERPESFQRVVSWVGTYVDIRGGHNYPPMIRKSEAKPIRVYLLAEEQDLDNQYGNWPLANRQMAKALDYKGYDHTLEFGPGFHGSRHAGVRLPDMLRWVWRDWK